MTSPVMTIRKVDKGSMVIGGGILEPLNGFGEGEEGWFFFNHNFDKISQMLNKINCIYFLY